MKSPEFEPKDAVQKPTADPSGYSEAKQAKAVESQFDLHQQKRNASLTTKAQNKTLFAYHEVSGKLAELINKYTELMEADLRSAQKLLEQIHELEKQREEIFKKLIG